MKAIGEVVFPLGMGNALSANEGDLSDSDPAARFDPIERINAPDATGRVDGWVATAAAGKHRYQGSRGPGSASHRGAGRFRYDEHQSREDTACLRSSREGAEAFGASWTDLMERIASKSKMLTKANRA